MKLKIEFIYNHKKNETTIYIWKGMNLTEKRTVAGSILYENQKKIEASIHAEK